MACLISLNEAFLTYHPAPGLYRSGVRYGRTQIWDTIPALYTRRTPEIPYPHGDCKSLTAALVAQYRLGIDPNGVNNALLPNGRMPAKAVFRWQRKPIRGTEFHILVQTPYGFEDPSKRLGMGSDENTPWASMTTGY
jgi:hypothetical protein